MSRQRRRVRHAEFADMLAEVRIVDLRQRALRTSRRLSRYRALGLLASLLAILAAMVAIDLLT